MLLGSLELSVLEGEEATRKNKNAIIVAEPPRNQESKQVQKQQE